MNLSAPAEAVKSATESDFVASGPGSPNSKSYLFSIEPLNFFGNTYPTKGPEPQKKIP